MTVFQINLIPPELQADRSLKLASRVVLARLYGLSKKGTRECWPTNLQLSQECGLAVHTVVTSLSELTTRKIISCRVTSFKSKRVRYISITYNPDSSSNELSSNELSSNELSSNELSSNERQKFTKRTMDSSLNEQSTYICREKDREVIENSESSTTIPARETTVPRYYDDIPDPDYDEMFTSEPDTYEADQETTTAPKIAQNAQEGINAPQTINYPSAPNTAPPTQYTSEIEGYSNTSPYNIPSRTFVPQSPEEVIPLIERFKASHKNERVFENIDVRYYAGRIFDNYFRPFDGSPGGEWVDCNNHVVPPFKIFGKISFWITKDQQAGTLALIQPDLEANKRYLEKICEMTDPARFKKQQTAVEAEFEVIDEQDKTQSTGTALRWPPSKPKTPEEEQKELERIKEVVKWM